MSDDATFGEPDLRTLRLATPDFDAQHLEAFVAYQRRFLEAAEEPAVHAVARAHQIALEDSGIDAMQLARMIPVIADFAGKRWALAQLNTRKTALTEKKANGHALNARETETLRRLPQELVKAADVKSLVQRYGRPIVDLLLSRENELVSLHERVSVLQRRG